MPERTPEDSNRANWKSPGTSPESNKDDRSIEVLIEEVNRDYLRGQEVSFHNEEGVSLMEFGWIVGDEVHLVPIGYDQKNAVNPTIVPIRDFLNWQQARDSAESKTLQAGGKEIHPGEIVTVLRSSGDKERDWILTSFGEKVAVVEKTDQQGRQLRKAVPIEDFISWQTE